MKTIYKYTLDFVGEQSIDLPINAEIISIQTQRNTICLWAIVSPDEQKTERTIHIRGTGHELPNVSLKFLGSTQLYDGEILAHVFLGI